MKKIISIFMSAAMCCALMSCNGSSDNTASVSNVQAIESVAVTQPDSGSEYENSIQASEESSDMAVSEQLPAESSNEEPETSYAMESSSEIPAQSSVPESDNGGETQPAATESSEIPAQSSVQETEPPAPVQEFSRIEIEVTTGTMYITVGDTLSFVRKDGTVLDYSITNGTLYAANDSSHTATLTLPRGGSYDEICLVVNEGHVFAEQAISTASLSVTMRKGEASLEQVSVSGSSVFDVDKGSLYVHGDIGSTVTASCDEGHLSMEVPYSQNEYNIHVEMTEGNVQVGTQSYHGRTASKNIDNGAARNADLSCRRGDISMQFNR